MTARISLILGKTRGHRPRLQMLLREFRNTLWKGGEWVGFEMASPRFKGFEGEVPSASNR